MRLQDSQANCGPAALSNALSAIGVVRTQEECASLAKTSATEGTSTKKLLAAIRAVGREPVVINEKRPVVAMLYLGALLAEGRSAVLCVDDSSHWVAAIGLLGPRVLVADSADSELVVSITRSELAEWWMDERCWGIVI